MVKRNRYTLDELIAQCDPDIPISEDVHNWDSAGVVGMEQAIISGQVDVREAILTFGEALADQFHVTALILFGSRARGDYQPDSDADVAVILKGEPGDFVETKLVMAGLAYDVLLNTGIRIQPFPLWESEWCQPARYSNPAILKHIASDGILIWHT